MSRSTHEADVCDLVVVGAGIVGLGHAAAAAERGLRVIVVERADTIAGASVRNFGHIGVGVHTGRAAEYARRSRDLWVRLAERAGFWVSMRGAIAVARHDDELAVLSESGVGTLLDAGEARDVVPVGDAVGAVLLADDLQVDPRLAAPAIAAHLAACGVDFRWRTSALGVEASAPSQLVHTSRGVIRADAVVIAVNADVDQLYPSIAEQYGVVRCGLDMLLADGVGLAVPLLTGSSMLRYGAFAGASAAADVRARIAATDPDVLAHDINQMYTQRPDGGLIVGDTHVSGTAIAPFQDERGFDLLLRLGAEMFGRPLRVRERWQGVYAQAPGASPFLCEAPSDAVRVVSVTSGIGMTCGLGFAESVISDLWQ